MYFQRDFFICEFIKAYNGKGKPPAYTEEFQICIYLVTALLESDLESKIDFFFKWYCIAKKMR